eukprot:9474367-Alexandrium_andersonii.AAC.1
MLAVVSSQELLCETVPHARLVEKDRAGSILCRHGPVHQRPQLVRVAEARARDEHLDPADRDGRFRKYLARGGAKYGSRSGKRSAR